MDKYEITDDLLFQHCANAENFILEQIPDEEDIDYDTILDFSCKGKHIKIVLEDDDISIVTFQCVSVKFFD